MLYEAQYKDQTSVDDVGITWVRADEVLGDPGEFPTFHLLDNNCESFATWLKTGKAYTAEGEKAKQRLTTIGVGVGAVAGAAIGKKIDESSIGVLAGAASGSVAGSALPSTSSALLSSGISDKSGSRDKSGSSDS